MALCICALTCFAWAMVDPNDCIPYRPPQEGHEETAVIRITERSTGLHYLEVMAANWLREEDNPNDPNAMTVRIRRFYPLLHCRAYERVNLAGDLNNDGRIDMRDLALYAKWWTSPYIDPYTIDGD